MTDTTTADAPTAPFQVTVNTQYIKDFSFESPNAPQIFTPSEASPELNVGVNVQTRPIGENTFEVLLSLKLDATIDKKKAFIAELAYGGAFTMPPMADDQLRYILLVEAPRLLFPFARTIIANAVRDGGFPQLLINPIDFAALYQSTSAHMDKPAEGTA